MKVNYDREGTVEIVLIGCIASNGVIGRGGRIPWDLPEDRKRFRSLTWGKGVVMGRNTYLSIGHPLPGRINIVLSRKEEFGAPGIQVCRGLDMVSKLGKELGLEELWVIGGGEVYGEFLPLAIRMELTILKQPFAGDVWFPRWEREEWKLVERTPGPRPLGDPLEHEYLRYRRIGGVPKKING